MFSDPQHVCPHVNRRSLSFPLFQVTLLALLVPGPEPGERLPNRTEQCE